MRKCLAVNINNHFNTFSNELSSPQKLLVRSLLEKHIGWRKPVACDIPSVQLADGAQHLLQKTCVPLHPEDSDTLHQQRPISHIIIPILSSSCYQYIMLSVVGRSSQTCAGLAEGHSHPEPVSVRCSAAQLWHATDKVQSTSQRMSGNSTACVMAQHMSWHSICHGTGRQF
jgi:hypothetical protein